MSLLDTGNSNTKGRKSSKTKLRNKPVRYALLTLRPDSILCPSNAGFMAQLLREMRNFQRLCVRQGVTPVFRLNTMSDVPWEKHIDIAGEFKESYFVDYTKLAHRLTRVPENYGLIFSYSGVPAYQGQVQAALKTDRPIAVVFRNGFPKRFLGRICIDGDRSDLINVQTRNSIICLSDKGDAKHDTSGFVVDNPDLLLAVA